MDTVFTFDEAKARTWIAAVQARHDNEWDAPEINQRWDPRMNSEDSQETYALCYAAQQVGIIVSPEGYELAYIEEYDSTYYWSARTPFGPRGLTLVTLPTECRKIGDPDVTGIDQAIAIICEGIREANALLASFTQCISPAPAPGAERVQTKTDDQPCPCGVSHTIAEHNYTPDAEKDTDDRYWSMTLDPENIDDLNTWVTQGKLVGIVDEQEGGIIAYVHDDASAQMLTTLRQQS